MSDHFTRPDAFYTNDLNVPREYVKQVGTLLSRINNTDPKDEFKGIVKKIKEGDAKNPIVTHTIREANRDKKVIETPLTEYIRHAKDEKMVLVPSFTAYTSEDKQHSIQKTFVLSNLTSRSKEKKIAAAYEAAGKMQLAAYHTVLQKTKKIFNNSLSGAYASPSSILYNPPAHYSLTSITRAVASIGNSLTESMVAGNRHYSSRETVLNHLAATITNINRVEVKSAILKYDLVIPTTKQLLSMVRYSSTFYWDSSDFYTKLEKIFDKLDDIDKASFMYVNDLYQIRQLNGSLVKKFLLNMSAVKTVGSNVEGYEDVLKNANGDVLNLMHHICLDDLRGLDPSYKDFENSPIHNRLVGTTRNIIHNLDNMEGLIKTFFLTKIMPIDIVDIKDMTRRAIVLSDTDSTCSQYGEWVHWTLNGFKFSDRGVGIAATVMSLVAGALGHYLKVLSGNMGVSIDKRGMLSMKNEFFWDSYTNANVSKQYYANTMIKEGVVFAKGKLEVKGAPLISSGLADTYREVVVNTMLDINMRIGNNEKLDLRGYIKDTISMEREIARDVHTKPHTLLKGFSIKHRYAYKNGESKPSSTPYFFHMLWEEVFAGKYGHAETTFPYDAYSYSVKLDTKSKTIAWLATIKDVEIREKMTDFLTKYDKFKMGRLLLPREVVNELGVPEEIMNIVDSHALTKSIVTPLYIIYETLGFYVKKKKLLSEMYT